MLDTKILHAVYIISKTIFFLSYIYFSCNNARNVEICVFRVSGWMMEAEAKGKKQNIIKFMTRIRCGVHEK